MSLELQQKLSENQDDGSNKSLEERLSLLGDETLLGKLRGKIQNTKSLDEGFNADNLDENNPINKLLKDEGVGKQLEQDDAGKNDEKEGEGGEKESEGDVNEGESDQDSLKVEDISVTLYGGKGKEQIKKEDVVDVVNALDDPYKSDIIAFIRGGEIENLQKYLNEEINSGRIDGNNLANFLESKDVLFDGKIKEDGKFGYQVLETLRFILDSQNNETTENNEIVDEDVESLEELDKKWVTPRFFNDMKLLLKEKEKGEDLPFSEFIKYKDETGGLFIDEREIQERKEGTKDICYRIVDDKIVFGHFNEDGSPVGEIVIVNDEKIRYGSVGNNLVFINKLDDSDTRYGWYISEAQNIENVLNYGPTSDGKDKIEDESPATENPEYENPERQ